LEDFRVDLRLLDFRLLDFLLLDFLAADFLLLDFLLLDFLPGTFAPSRRASERPIAIACLRLFTSLPERPLFSVPCLRSCIAGLTFCPAFLPYLAMCSSDRKTIS